MLDRLLVANRGEIACRIARTARRLGITTLAVYSDADRNARHVREADEAFRLGPAPPLESYLDIERILRVARQARADAIHPGYGFLSENADFAQACVAAGFIFVGPPAAAILAMGSKSAAKAAMAAIGVPIAPGYHGAEQSLERLTSEAARVGYPLLIKASAGGGGKGMQIVHTAAELEASIASAQRLARAAFRDDRLLLERYFARARHVEVQIFADRHGNVISLLDRDCSVQRRLQKVLEEAPAPGLRDTVRSAMASAAIAAARSVGYVGAGTVEFLLDEEQNFYFMEMNTRLQVEHPVTELVAGIDLVEWQIRIARGETLPAHGAPRGAAVEARLYAEDPAREYLPSVGTITHLRWPAAVDGVRLDTGFDAGDAVSPFYDPLLGKIIAWGESRDAAVASLHRALAALEITGVATNRMLLLSVLADPQFRAGQVATDFLNVRAPYLALQESPVTDLELILAALWCATRCTAEEALWQDTRGWRLGSSAASRWRFDGREVVVSGAGADCYRASLESQERTLRLVRREDCALEVECDGVLSRVRVVEQGGTLHLFSAGRHATLKSAATDDALATGVSIDTGSLLTPLPGTIVALHVAVGDQVKRGAPLVTVEAMKMEHTLTAPQDGIVARLRVALQDRVPAETILIDLNPAPEP
jgi:3-methylcrotonyl-CoA carboxylase alpha subunit